MIEETGVVKAVHDDLAEVLSRRRSACGTCSINGACGTSLLERFFGRRELLLTVYNPIGARPGDSVVFGIPEQSLLAASFAAYVVPLIAMIAGGIGGGALAEIVFPGYENGLSVLGGVFGLSGGLFWLGRFGRSRARGEAYRAIVLRRMGAGGLDVVIPNQSLQEKH